jgi:hypothetical protein
MTSSILSEVEGDAKKITTGAICEVAGAIAFFAGVLQLFHHAAIAGCVIGGAAIFLVGKKLRQKTS